MSRKHNTKHTRKRSRYPERLKKRGMSSAAVRMDDLETLRKRAGRRDDFGLLSSDYADGVA